ncbi:MAG: hypothetical protein K6T83_09185 [Alicyclobacillus sp.]|nr:hypothetical protein [Alicyclobacillus sp.]
MIIILLIIIAVLLFLLLFRRSGGGWRPGGWNNGYRRNGYDVYDVTPPGYGYGPATGGLSGGSFLGGMAAGALLTWLLEQGRIDMMQYNYFNSLGEEQMLNELMQQNIIQQHEIDALQQQLASDPNAFHDGQWNNQGPDGGQAAGPSTDPGAWQNDPYSQVDFHPDNGYDQGGGFDDSGLDGDAGFDDDTGFDGDAGFDGDGGFDGGSDDSWV